MKSSKRKRAVFIIGILGFAYYVEGNRLLIDAAVGIVMIAIFALIIGGITKIRFHHSQNKIHNELLRRQELGP
jgi:hypothetical protein